jgi:hypothetical protein
VKNSDFFVSLLRKKVKGMGLLRAAESEGRGYCKVILLVYIGA